MLLILHPRSARDVRLHAGVERGSVSRVKKGADVAKTFTGRACAYCGSTAKPTIAEHVVARKFFAIRDRDRLPKVAGCEDCNSKKSELEGYALTVLPFGSRLDTAGSYFEEHIPGRLKGNRHIHREINRTAEHVWEISDGGVALPTMAFGVDTDRLKQLFNYIITGLYAYEFKVVLPPRWFADTQIIDDDGELNLGLSVGKFLGPAPVMVRRNLGQGTFTYRVDRSCIMTYFSIWQFYLFGGLALSGDPNHPGKSFSKFTCVTRPRVDLQDVTDEDLGLVRELDHFRT